MVWSSGVTPAAVILTSTRPSECAGQVARGRRRGTRQHPGSGPRTRERMTLLHVLPGAHRLRALQKMRFDNRNPCHAPVGLPEALVAIAAGSRACRELCSARDSQQLREAASRRPGRSVPEATIQPVALWRDRAYRRAIESQWQRYP